MKIFANKVIDILPPSKPQREALPRVEAVEVAPRSQNLTDSFKKAVSQKKIVTQKPAGGIHDLVNEIISEPMSDRDVMEALMNQSNDPVVELASMGVTVMGTIPTMGMVPITDEEFYHKIISQIHAPTVRSAVNLSSVKPQVKVASLAVSPAGTYNSQGAVRAKIALPVQTGLPAIPAQGGQPGLSAQRAGRIVSENRIDDFYKNPPVKNNAVVSSAKLPVRTATPIRADKRAFNFAPPPKKNYFKLFSVILAVFAVVIYGSTLKHELVRDSSLAIENLGKAGENLKNFDFTNAAENFRKSYADLSGASQNLNLAGAGLANIFSDLPGFGKLKSAKDIVEAGKLLAKSGEAMSEAMSALSQTGAILNPNDGNKVKPSKIIRQLKDALDLSGKNLSKAKALISGIDESVIPEDKKQTFHNFKDKIPMFEKILSDSQDYVDFLQGVVGMDESKKYLLLFNNYSELRPTGGFPGTYGVISFSNGGLENFFVDDVYNLDGQLKENIIPPKPLQHITPTLGMRDSSWFIDFPMSARKAMSFFAKEAGYKVDGVIALNPDVISHVLEAVGPIEMPEYKLTLTADNFLESIQKEVEYGENKAQPKTVVVDLAPRLLAKLYSATPEQWMKIFNSWMASLEEKDIIFYMDDKESEDFIVKEGFGGEIKKTDGDYLDVNLTNVKGSKTDAVTDTNIEIENTFEGGHVVHKVTLTRVHKGGDSTHGFYNRQNPAYVRLLLPENAEFLTISGNDSPNFKPLISYFGSGFSEDRDLKALESTIYHDPVLNIDVYKEPDLSGQTRQGIGFWMITDPASTKKVEFEYTVPVSDDYSFYFQKQPGLDWKNFKFVLNSHDGKRLIDASPELNKVGDSYVFDDMLKKDLQIKLKFSADGKSVSEGK